MIYPLEVTSLAEQQYEALYEQAQSALDRGQHNHVSVARFRELEEVWDEVLPVDPEQPDRALAGKLSFVYCLSLKSVVICYRVRRDPRSLIVLTIFERGQSNQDDREIATTLMENGEMNKLLKDLGIKDPLSKIKVNEAVVM